MGKKYIIELEEKETAYKTVNSGEWPMIQLLNKEPYTEPDLDAIRNEAYEKGVQDTKQHWVDAPRSCAYKLGYENGINDAWEAVRKIGSNSMCSLKEMGFDFSQCTIADYNPSWFIVKNYSVSECIEKIRQYEQEQEESEESKKEQSVTAEEVMRQYLDRFCKGKSCTRCPLYTSDFTCGRGYHFLTNRVSDEEVRRAYAEVLEKMREGQDE